MGTVKINVSDTSGQSWPLVLHQIKNANSTGWGAGIKFLNASDSSSKWAGIGGMATSVYANNNDLVFYTDAEARFSMNNNTFYPIGDGIYNCGGPTVRWNNIYGINLIANTALLNGYEALTAGNGGFVALDRDMIGTSYNIDDLTTNMFFEVRGANEVTVSGTRPFSGYYGLANFHLPVCKLQIAGSNLHGFAIRGIQQAGATLKDQGWHFLLTHANYSSYALPISGGTLTGSPAIIFPPNPATISVSTPTALTHGRLTCYGTLHINANTDNSGTEYVILTAGKGLSSSTADGLAIGTDTLTWKDYDILTTAGQNYIKVYNSSNIVGSSDVTVNDLANQGFAAAMIHASTDNPRGKANWVHVLSMAWGAGDNNNWISQLAFGVEKSDGLWYRTNQNNSVGSAWKRVLDSSNYTDYAAPAAYSWRTGNASDANGESHYLNGAWRTADGCANVPVGNGFLWSINGDGGGFTTVQFSGTYNMTNIYYRSKWYSNGWTNWYTLLSSRNYNSYSPTLTGGGASGTWGINITGNAATASYIAPPVYMHPGISGQGCYPCFARITVTSNYSSRPGEIVLSSRNRNVCRLQIRFPSQNTTDPSVIYLNHDSGGSYHGIFAVKVATSTWDLYYSKSEAWDDITVHQYFSSDFNISFPGGYITSIPDGITQSIPLPARGTVNYGTSQPTHTDFAGMVYYQLI